MLNPLNSGEMDDYVQRLNAQLRKMPPQERAEVNQELRQHLEAQAQAHEELGATPAEAMQSALRSFGDPRRIGRRMFCEWKWGKHQKVVYKIGTFVFSYVTLALIDLLCSGLMPSHYGPPNLRDRCVLFGLVPALTGMILGGCSPKVALHNTVCTLTGWIGFFFLLNTICYWRCPNPGEAYVQLLSWTSLNTICWLTVGGLFAYIASARRRGGWYRLRLSDLKLRLR